MSICQYDLIAMISYDIQSYNLGINLTIMPILCLLLNKYAIIQISIIVYEFTDFTITASSVPRLEPTTVGLQVLPKDQQSVRNILYNVQNKTINKLITTHLVLYSSRLFIHICILAYCKTGNIFS